MNKKHVSIDIQSGLKVDIILATDTTGFRHICLNKDAVYAN